MYFGDHLSKSHCILNLNFQNLWPNFLIFENISLKFLKILIRIAPDSQEIFWKVTAESVNLHLALILHFFCGHLTKFAFFLSCFSEIPAFSDLLAKRNSRFHANFWLNLHFFQFFDKICVLCGLSTKFACFSFEILRRNLRYSTIF